MGRIVPAPIIGQSAASGAQVIDGSLTFDSTKSTHLTRTPTAVGNRRTWTWSAWVKRNKLGERVALFTAATDNTEILFEPDDKLRIYFFPGSYAGHTKTNAKFRDTSAWYHIVFTVDTTQTGNNNISKIYVNGVQQEVTYPNNWTQNAETNVNNTVAQYIGSRYGPGRLINAQLSNVYLIDGQALGPENFGFTDPLTGTWRPKKYTGTFGTNGFWLPMDGNSPIGEDKSGIVTPNNGSIWSNSLTSSSGFRSSEPKTNAFDGNTSSICSAVGSGTITFTSPVTFASNSTIRVFLHGGDHTVTVNGGSNQTISAGSFQTVTYSNSGNANFVMTFHRGGGADTGVRAIEIDGVILTDGQIGNNWTPVNFGGSVELDKATGAKPILNTTQGGTHPGVGVFGSKENKNYTVTVASVDGGNRYHFDGVDRPNPTLIRGATYTFDQSDSSNGTGGTHPLRFATAADAAGSSQYTDGVVTNGTPGQAGAYTKITVPHNAPDTLYYYCTNHGGMGSSTSQTTDETKADPYAWKCVFASPLIGSDDDVSNQINCTSTTKATTTSGAAADSSDSNFYGGSYVFDGSNDYVKTDANSADFNFGSGDFTLECWINADGAASKSLFSLWDYQNSQRSWNLYVNSNTQVVLITSTNGSGQSDVVGPTANTKLTLNKWTHVAVTKESNTYRCFIDGDLKESNSVTETIYNNTNDPIYIGCTNGVTEFYDGHIQDVRIYKGVAKYTSNFIPASTSPDVLPDTPSGVGGSSKLTKITDGSFNNPVTGGISKFGNISVADSADLEFGSGDFTLEAFIYYVGNPGTGNDTYAILSKWNNVSAPFDKGFILRISDDGSGDNLQWFYTTDGSTNLYTTGSTLLNPNTWYHIAFVRNGTTGTFYIDGVADSTTVSFGSNSIRDTGNAFRIGANLDGDDVEQEFNGFISNVRVLKGTALYTSKFTPPSEPLTNITNTKILACQDNDYNVVGYTTTTANGASPIFNTTGDYGETYGDGNLNADPNASNLVLCCDFYANATDRMPTGRPSNQKSLSAGGNPNPGNATTSHFYGKSAHFDGNDQYSISSSADFSFDGEFCIELWANASSWGPFFVSGGTNGIWLGSTNNGLVIRRYGVQNDLLVQVPPYSEWVHLAFTRDDSNILRIFINGEEQMSGVVDFTYTQNTLYIGGDGAGAYYTGYIQDLRVYKGTAKYTSDFNPPFRSLNKVKAAVSPSQFRHTRFAGGPVSFSPFITDIDTVRGQETGYATLNPLRAAHTYSNGNLDWTFSTTGNTSIQPAMSTLVMESGKWFWETTIRSGATGIFVGIWNVDNFTNDHPGSTSDSYAYWSNNGNKYNNDSNSSYGIAFTTVGTVVGTAYDADNGTIEFFNNGISQGVAYSDITQRKYVAAYHKGTPGTDVRSAEVNFGQKPFKFPPPDGFQPLNTANTRPVKVISRPDQYVGVTTYSGSTGTGTIKDDNINFTPDFVWVKDRGGTEVHALYDTVRGSTGGNFYRLSSNSTAGNNSPTNELTSMIRGGFTANNNGHIFSNGKNYVSWMWKAGGNSNTFNIDDVGYANASDVGMNAGGQNSNAYDQSQTWSTYGSGSSFNPAITTLFDNDLTTGPSTPAGTTASWTFKNSITASKSIEIYCSNGSGAAGSQTSGTEIRLTVDGVVCGIDGSPGWIDTGLTGTLTEITIHVTGGSGSPGLRAIRVDGKELVDAGVSVPNVPSVPNTGCSVGTKQGFSIVAYNATGSDLTVSHGLSKRPGLIILKSKNVSGDWLVWHQSLAGVDRFLKLNETITQTQASNVFLSVDENTFGTGNDSGINSSNQEKLAYIWCDVPGLQKFGTYEGNTSTPAFVNLGFRPAMIWIKAIDQTWYWNIHDSKRSPINPTTGNFLRPDETFVEGVASGNNNIDFLSNGFKIRSTTAQSEPTNVNGQTYIYCAWAEAPPFSLYGGQSNAR